MRYLFILVFAVLAACTPKPKAEISGQAQVYYPMTLSFEGPELAEVRETFTDYRLQVRITHTGTGMAFDIPGYFAGDGAAAQSSASSGKVWQVKFTPMQNGKWVYETKFVKGKNIALDPLATGESAGYFDGASSTFQVAQHVLDESSNDFRHKGMLLKPHDKRYLQYAGTQDYFLKTGAGSPENILGYAGFDGTFDAGGTHFPALGEDQLHHFEPHMRDAKPGDPTWQDGKGASLLGIGNYYAEVGVNAQYMVVMNVEGDGQDVWPWTSHTDPYVFDVSKLAQWERALSHFNANGVLIDMLLTECENESWFEATDETDANFADSRKLYYREMVARFGHLNGLVWNLGEENGADGNSGNEIYRKATTAKQRLAFAKYIYDLDPYGHAIVSHNWPETEAATFGEKLGVNYWSGISQQGHDNYNAVIVDWLAKSKAAGHQWMITMDEPLGWEFGARPDSEDPEHEREIKEVLWPVLMAGGAGVDWYFGWQNNAPTSDLSNEDQRSRHNLWVKSAEVRKWWEDNVPFWDMKAANEIHGGEPLLQFLGNRIEHPVITKEGDMISFSPAGAAGSYAIYPDEAE